MDSNTAIYQKVIDFCHENLAYEGSVKDYLRRRFVSDEMISKYKLGAWPRNIYTLMQAVDPSGLREVHLLWNDKDTGKDTGKFRNHKLQIGRAHV